MHGDSLPELRVEQDPFFLSNPEHCVDLVGSWRGKRHLQEFSGALGKELFMVVD